MNEFDLYKYALIAVLIGFLLLGFVVFFIPVSFDDATLDYIDGTITSIHQNENGVVVHINRIGQEAIFLDKQSNLSVGVTYRFYEPLGDELLFVDNYRILS